MKTLCACAIVSLVASLMLTGCGLRWGGGGPGSTGTPRLVWTPEDLGTDHPHGHYESPGVPAGTLRIVNAGNAAYDAVCVRLGDAEEGIEECLEIERLLPGASQELGIRAGFYEEIAVHALDGPAQRFAAVPISAGDVLILMLGEDPALADVLGDR